MFPQASDSAFLTLLWVYSKYNSDQAFFCPVGTNWSQDTQSHGLSGKVNLRWNEENIEIAA